MSHSSPLPIGQLITSPQVRDAIHVAVAPLYAAKRLKPGQHIGLDSKGAAVAAEAGNGVGIVDPFLLKAVQPGQQFWGFVYPYTVTSLSHQWTHPAFKEVPPMTAPTAEMEAKARLEEFADEVGLSYHSLMGAAHDFVKHEEYLIQGGRFEGQGLPDTFWDDYQLVTGEEVPANRRWSFFSCAC